MRKKLICVFFSLVVILTSGTSYSAYANEANQVDAYLIEHGFTQEALDNMLDDDKEYYYNQNCSVISITQYDYDEDMNLISTRNLAGEGADNQIMPYGQISSTTLSLLWYITKNNDTGNITVEYSYIWNKVPTSRFQDPIGVSWDSKYFRMKDGGFRKSDYYFITNSGGGSNSVLYSEEDGYANGNENGVVWYADLYKGSNCSSLRGKGLIVLIPKKTSGSTTFYGHYVHRKLGVSLSMSIPALGSFSVSGASTYDERGNQKTINL